MSKPDDGRAASVAVQEAADVLMLRWTAQKIGGGAAEDARVLRCLNSLDAIAEELGEIEQQRGRPGDRPDGRFCPRLKQAMASAVTPFVPRSKPLQPRAAAGAVGESAQQPLHATGQRDGRVALHQLRPSEDVTAHGGTDRRGDAR
jgi:hypothetical protein